MIDGDPRCAPVLCLSTRRARRRSSACAPRTEPAPLGAFLRSGTRRRAAPSRRSSSTPRARASRSTGRRGRSTPSTTTRASCRNTHACARPSSARSPGPSVCFHRAPFAARALPWRALPRLTRPMLCAFAISSIGNGTRSLAALQAKAAIASTQKPTSRRSVSHMRACAGAFVKGF